jgi:hypothetical protein
VLDALARDVASGTDGVVERPAHDHRLEKSDRDGTVMANPALDVPFITTRGRFVLELDNWPGLAGR